MEGLVQEPERRGILRTPTSRLPSRDGVQRLEFSLVGLSGPTCMQHALYLYAKLPAWFRAGVASEPPVIFPYDMSR